MIRKKQSPAPDIDIPLATTGSIDPHKLSASEKRHRQDLIKRFLFTFGSVTLILLSISLILFLYTKRDKISARSLKSMWNSLWGIEISSSVLDWNLTPDAAFAPYQGGVVAADSSAIRVLGADGLDETLGDLSFPTPLLAFTEDRFLVFDKTTGALAYSDGTRLLLSLSAHEGVKNACLSEGGVATLSSEEGYLSAACAYDRNGSLLVEYKTPAYFGVLSYLSSDQKTLIFVGVSSGPTALQASVLFIDIANAEVRATLPLGESLPLGIQEYGRGEFAVVADNAVYAFDSSGKLTGSYDFGNMELSAFAFGEDFAVCVLRRHLVGELFSIMTFDKTASVEASIVESREPRSLAAAGRLVALSYGDTAAVYPASLGTHTDFTFEKYIDKLALEAGGTVVALCDGVLYVS